MTPEERAALKEHVRFLSDSTSHAIWLLLADLEAAEARIEELESQRRWAPAPAEGPEYDF